jgi:hypothetical protein
MLKVTREIIITHPITGDNITMVTPTVEINSSRTSLTDTAKIKAPRRMQLFHENGKPADITEVLQRGSKVEIYVGYNDQNTKRFTGYVTGIDARVPLTITCQDEMWKLKQNSFTASFTKNTKVDDIVKMVYTGERKVVDLTIGGWVIKRQNTAQVLEGLKKFGLQCYFMDGVLMVDFAGALHGGRKEVFFDFNQNVVSVDLEYKRKDDARIKVRGVSQQTDGTKIEIVAGDNDGEEHTLNYTGLTKPNLQMIVNAEINMLKQDGFTGEFTAFGWPIVNPGDIAVLTDPDYPEHDGSYLVEGVTVTDDRGLRQKIKLERKLA